MKCLKRNMTEFEYLPYGGTESDLNEDGEHTGDFTQREYGTPIPMKGNISVPSGHTNTTFYGDDIRYTHTLVMEHPKEEINEYGVIRWNNDLYDIQAVRPSLNSVSVALKKQTEAHDDPYVAPDDDDDEEEPEDDET